MPIVHTFGLEDLFYEHGVDLEIWAHEHAYERLWPIYDFKVLNGSKKEPYTNPRAPVHIITGSAVSVVSSKLVIVHLYPLINCKSGSFSLN